MSSALDWWDDDEEITEPQTQLSIDPFSQDTFRCVTCGGTESYTDSTTDREVCTTCFTQSQVINSQTAEDEDVELLGARRGGIARFTNRARASFGRGGRRQSKQPLESLDTSQPLPSLDVCLNAMAHVIMNAARVFAQQVLGLDTVEKRREYLETVKCMWLKYLHAWREGANEIGSAYPQWRFSFRDHFIPNHIRGILTANIAFNSAKKLKEQELPNETLERQQNLEEGQNNTEKSGKPKRTTSTDNERKKCVSRDANSLKRLILSFGERADYKRAALKVHPSMDMILALLWLSCSKSGITSFEVCEWMTHSPLLNANDLLPVHLREAVSAIRSFFLVASAPRPCHIEDTASLLAVACQMKTRDNWSVENKEIKFHSNAVIPLIVAKLVAKAGLNQGVLDRSLCLLGLAKGSVEIMPKLALDHFTRNEDFLACIAIACVMDPEWESWSFSHSARNPTIPLNECQLGHLTYAGLSTHLSVVDRSQVMTQPRVWKGFDRLMTQCDKLGEDEDGNDIVDENSAVAVKRCRVFAGAKNPTGNTNYASNFLTLIGFLAYSVQADVNRIREKVKLLVEMRKMKRSKVEESEKST